MILYRIISRCGSVFYGAGRLVDKKGSQLRGLVQHVPSARRRSTIRSTVHYGRRKAPRLAVCRMRVRAAWGFAGIVLLVTVRGPHKSHVKEIWRELRSAHRGKSGTHHGMPRRKTRTAARWRRVLTECNPPVVSVCRPVLSRAMISCSTTVKALEMRGRNV